MGRRRTRRARRARRAPCLALPLACGVGSPVYALACGPEGRLLAAAGPDGVKVWDLTTGKEAVVLEDSHRRSFSVTFSPDGQRLAASSADGRGHDILGHVWDVRSGRALLKKQLEGEVALAYSPDGTRLAAACWSGSLRVWNAESGADLFTVATDPGRVYKGLAWSPDGTRLACCTGVWEWSTERLTGLDVRVWRASDGQLLLTLAPHEGHSGALAYSPDGTRLASTSGDGTVILHDAGTGQPLLDFRGHTGVVWWLAFSPDGERLASASNDGTVKVWAVQTGRELLTCRPHPDAATCVVFTPDGRLLASGGKDGVVQVWDASGPAP